MTGDTLAQRKIMKNNKKNIPHFSKKFSIYRYLNGKKENNTFDPSRGGMGIRLKIIRTKLSTTMILVIL